MNFHTWSGFKFLSHCTSYVLIQVTTLSRTSFCFTELQGLNEGAQCSVYTLTPCWFHFPYYQDWPSAQQIITGDSTAFTPVWFKLDSWALCGLGFTPESVNSSAISSLVCSLFLLFLLFSSISLTLLASGNYRDVSDVCHVSQCPQDGLLVITQCDLFLIRKKKVLITAN